MSKAPRWRRRKDARPPEIIAAALESFVARGFAATRLEDIAARAGVTRGTLYLYFPNKEELFKAVVRENIVPILARGEAEVAASRQPAAELLRRLILSFPASIVGTPASAIPKLILAEARNFPDLARFYLDEVVQRGRRLIAGLIQRGIDNGEFRPVDIDQAFFCTVAPMLLATLWQHTFQHYQQDVLDPHRLAEAHVDLLLHGLLRPETKP